MSADNRRGAMGLKPWRVAATRETHRDRWLTLRTDTCSSSDGEALGDFHTLVYPDWVNVVALTPAGDIVLVKEYRHARRSIARGLPGGALSSSEESPRQAAARELLEETGYESQSLVELGHSAPNAATHTNLVWSFLALSARRSREPQQTPGERVEVELRDFATYLRDVADGGDEAQALHLATLLLAVRAIVRDRSPSLTRLRDAVLTGLTSTLG